MMKVAFKIRMNMPRGVRRNINNAGSTDTDKNNAGKTEVAGAPKAVSEPEITLKNKKSEILEALNAALKREKERAEAHYEPEKEEARQKAEFAVKETRNNVGREVFSEELNQKFNNL